MENIKSVLGKIYNKNVKFFDLGIIVVFLSLFLMILGQEVGYLTVGRLLEKPILADGTGFWSITYMYASFIGIWIVVVLWCLVFKKNRPILKSLGTKPRGNNIKMLLIGLLIGFGTNMLCAVAAMLHKDIFIYFDSIQPLKLLILFIAVFIQSSAEELLCRGFLYQRLRKTFRHPAVAIIISSALFGFLHIFNSGVTPLAIVDIIVTGIFFVFMVYYMDSIWCAFGVHTAWNYTQNIILGLPNSGNVSPFSIFKLDAASARDSIVYNVGFGVEGTSLAIAVQIIGAIVIYVMYRKKTERDYDTWNLKNTET
ncbi:MAG: CPBP family intramembrane metalloprotease [Butyrivibrio sp.]|nr:CPBP family intramembrane metalloprotease [Butyrivibrio sp.]